MQSRRRAGLAAKREDRNARGLIRRIDFYAADWISGTAGLSAPEIGVYITICALIYVDNKPIPYDERRISSLAGIHWRTFRKVRAKLERRGKIVSENGQISVKRCAEELQRAFKRASEAAQNGAKGGRPKGLAKPEGFGDRKANNLQSTIYKHHIEDS